MPKLLERNCTIYAEDVKLVSETGVVKDLQNNMDPLPSLVMAMDPCSNPFNNQNIHIGRLLERMTYLMYYS